MRRIISVGTIAMLAFGMNDLVAQVRPNFTGNWTNADPKAAASAEGIMYLGFAFTAEQDDKTLVVTPTIHQVHRSERPEQLRAVFNLDGSESKNPLIIHRDHLGVVDRTSRVRWDGDKLVLTTKTADENHGPSQTQTWSLDASGRLIVDAIFTYRGNSTTSQATYKKG